MMKEKPRREEWHDGGLGSRLLFRARAGAWELNDRVGRWNGSGKECKKCWVGGERVEETTEHLITECKAYERERGVLEERIRRCVGVEVWEEVKIRDDRGMAWLLGLEGLDGDGMKERSNGNCEGVSERGVDEEGQVMG